ncbi:MAG TPA: FecR domain-containing protein [Rhizomicrobium sp.]
MTGANEEQASFGSQSVEEIAAAWLERRDRGGWTDQDQTELDAWLAASPAHMTTYWRLDGAWNYADRLAALGSSANYESEAIAPERKPVRRWFGLAIAAVFVAVAGIAAASYLLRTKDVTYATAIGGHRLVTLADGSKIELDTDTVLRTAISSDRRIAWLDKGAAFFQIVHDASRPFIVITGDQRVTDLGTAFMVRRDTQRVEVAVVDGRVWFDAANGHATDNNHMQPVLLARGDEAIVMRGALSLVKKPAPQLLGELGWRRGVLVFNNTPLAAAAAEFNRYNHEQLVVADRAAGRMLIGATFRTSDVDLFARVARDVLGLRVEKNGQEIVISR